MRKIILAGVILILGNQQLLAQSLAVNTTGAAADASAMVDITSTTKGLLIPRVALTALNAASPLTSPVSSLLVYNTATAGAAATLVSPGYYYWDAIGLKWVAVSGNGSNSWGLLGNYNSVSTTNYIGSNDNVDVVFKTNNTETYRMTNGQRLLVGITTLSAPSTQKVEVYSATGDALYGHSPNVGGWLGYETNFVVGTAGAIQGSGLYATNTVAGYTASYAASSGAATVAANINFSSIWIASYNLVDNSSSTFNPPGLYGQLNNTSSTMGAGSFKNAVYGYSNRGTTTGNPGYTVGVTGIANSQNEDAIGIVGRAFCSSGFTLGGYFEGNNYAGTNVGYAYVGGDDGFGSTKITGLGAVAEIVPTPTHGRISLTCPESPEYWYQDYGSVTLKNGKAHVDLDPILVDVVFIDDKNPIRVFCTPVDMLFFNGVTMVNQSATGFDLVELNGGKHSGKLDYQVIVKPRTNYGVGRFPQAPGPAYVKSNKEPAAAKAKNNPKDGRKIFRWPSDGEVYKYNPEDLVGKGEVIPAGPHRGMVKMPDGTYVNGTPLDKSTLVDKK